MSKEEHVMKRRYGILLCIVAVALTVTQCYNSVTNTNTDSLVRELRPLTQTEQKIATSSQSFGVDVFKNVVGNGDKNVFISPLSLSMALAMTVNGAAGDTRTAMLKTLDVSDSNVQDLDASYQSLMKLLTNADPKVQMELANAIWYRNTFSVQQSFINTCQKYYGARVQGLNFKDNHSADIINNWVSDQTHGKITKMVQAPIDPNIVMYLMNAIYFKGNWRYQFDKKKTAPDDFTLSDGSKVRPEMMHVTTTMPFYGSDEVQMLDMAYGDSLFSMTVLLPPLGTSIDDFVAKLTRDKLNNWIGQLHPLNVQITMPKFKIKCDTTFKQALIKMEMGVAYDPLNADFTKINPDKKLHLHISKVEQKSFVNVDEKGTEAAAVTKVTVVTVICDCGGINDDYIFNVDRPFVYLIRERTSGTILFIGKMENPLG